MREIKTEICTLCKDYCLIPSSCWGVLGESSNPITIILQQSDLRENGGYLPALLKSKTGGIIKRVTGGYLEDLAIINSVKCIHSFNRKKDPPIKAVRNCREILQKQIREISPRGILISGAVAFRSLLNLFDNSSGSILRGQEFIWNNVPTLYIGHLARSATNEEIKIGSEFISKLRKA